MKQTLLFLLIAGLVFPYQALSAEQVTTMTGIVIRTAGSQAIFKTTSGATYAAETSQSQLIKKYGSAMQFSDIQPSDKLRVTGKLWSDNSISAYILTNLSLYPHNSAFNAKVISLDTYHTSLTMESKQFGTQIVNTNSLTIFKMNGSPSKFQLLEPGMNVKVKATWERNYSNVTASSVEAIVRMINLEFTGQVKGKAGTSLTVVANGVIYGVETSGAKLTNKNNKPLNVGEINLDDQIKVTGKHRSGDVKVVGVKLRDLSISK